MDEVLPWTISRLEFVAVMVAASSLRGSSSTNVFLNDAASGKVPQHLFEKSGVELSPKALTRFPFSIQLRERGR